MGFSLDFMRIGPGEIRDPDREGIAAWLAARELRIELVGGTHQLRGAAGPLTLDGAATDLHLDPLDQQKPVTGGIGHATLGHEERAFAYDLCIAGGMLIMNPQGGPLLIVPGGNHTPEDLPPSLTTGDVAWIESPDELAEVLAGGFDRFTEFRDRAVGEP